MTTLVPVTFLAERSACGDDEFHRSGHSPIHDSAANNLVGKNGVSSGYSELEKLSHILGKRLSYCAEKVSRADKAASAYEVHGAYLSSFILVIPKTSVIRISKKAIAASALCDFRSPGFLSVSALV